MNEGEGPASCVMSIVTDRIRRARNSKSYHGDSATPCLLNMVNDLSAKPSWVEKLFLAA